MAFLLLINKNELQNSVAFRIGTNMSAYTYKLTSSISDYFGLKSKNDMLAVENAELRTKITNLETQIGISADSALIGCDPNVKYIPAKIIHSSIYDVQNFIIIDKGSNNGVEPDMGVISPNGVVGVVQRVSGNFAVVLPLINPDLVVSAKIKDSKQLGKVVWNTKNPKETKLEDIPSHVNPEAGDSIVTSGFSAIFPEGMFIGTIEKAIQNEHTMFCDIDVSIAVDFQSLSHVTVTGIKNKNELSDLQNSLNNEK